MTVKRILCLLLEYEIIVLTSPSIAGVTYMDHFDFEERYRDVNECNPFYWHPLHMPEFCANMYEKLIRSKLSKFKPLRVMRERDGPEDDVFYNDPLYPSYSYPDSGYGYSSKSYRHSSRDDYTYPLFEMGEFAPAPLSPHEVMLELLKKDIAKDPSLPRLGVLPNLGPVAIYDQEVSKKSESVIKELATAYAKYGQESYAHFYGYDNVPNPKLYVWDSHKNKTDTKKNKNETNKKKSRISRTKTKHGGLVTIVETLKPRKRRSVLQFFGLLQL